MDRWLITFLTGAILSLFLPIVPDFSHVIFLTTLAFFVICIKPLRYLAALLFGMSWLLYSAASYENAIKLNFQHTEKLFQSNVLIEGEITSLVTTNNSEASNTRFNLLLYKVNEQVLEQPFKVRLSWNNASKPLGQGQIWQLNVKLKPAHGLANSGGFNYKTWLRRNELVASGYVKTKTKAKTNKLVNEQITLRQSWFDDTQKAISTPAPLFFALTFGVRDGLDKTDWQILADTGTQHLLAISGLHIGLIAGASFYLVKCLLFILPLQRLPLNIQQQLMCCNVYKIAIVASLLSALFYSYLAGFSSPTCRALIMLTIFWLSRWLSINLTKTRLLLGTLALAILLQPLSMLSTGFWLSFYAVALIFYLHWLFQFYFDCGGKLRRYFMSLLIIQLGLSLFMLPVAAFMQYQIPLAAIIANLIAVPLLSLICLPMVLFAFVVFLLFASPFLIEILAQPLLSLLWQWLSLFEQFDFLMVKLDWQGLLCLIILLVVVLICLSKFRLKWAFLICIIMPISLAYALQHSFASKPISWKVVVFDVGQGLSVLFEKNGRGILYDTGASYPSGFIMAESVIAPYLKKQGIDTLDKVIISHSDNDHAGGLAWLRNHFDIEEVVANDNKLAATEFCHTGNSFTWQGIRFDILYPEIKNAGTENDDSCVISISDGKNSVLLTGDISKKLEAKLALQYGDNLASQIMLAPHHGSNTSSSLEFIQTVQPMYVVFSAGFRNRWRLPTEKVQKNYQVNQVKSLKTAESGMISFDMNNSGIVVTQYKKQQYPFWFAN